MNPTAPMFSSLLLLSAFAVSSLHAQAPSYTKFGSGCAGSVGVPILDAAVDNLPIFGEVFTAELSNVPNTGLAIGILGLSKTSMGGLPLPLDLGTGCMPGCMLLTDIRRQANLGVFGGRATWDVAIPAGPEWLGRSLYQQVMVIDPQAGNVLGAVMSNGAEVVIGGRADLTLQGGLGQPTPTSAVPGGHLILPWVLANGGLAPAQHYRHGFYLSTDSTITTGDTLLRVVGRSNILEPGSTFPGAAVRLDIPSATRPGTYWLGMIIDLNDEVDESDENNNIFARRFDVAERLPDLMITTRTPLSVVPSEVRLGGSVRLAAPIILTSSPNPTS